MDAFCSSRNLPSTVYHEPTLQDMYHHLSVDDERKLIFCYVPKVRSQPKISDVVGSQTHVVEELLGEQLNSKYSLQALLSEPEYIDLVSFVLLLGWLALNEA